MFGVGGDTLVTMALAGSLFFSISPQAARSRVGLYLLLTVAPFALLSPLVGPALDRSRGGRRAMLVGAAGSRAVICLSMAGHLQSLWLFPESFALLVLSKAQMVAKSALVPSTVADERQLVAANARLALVSALGGLVAALPGLVVLRVGFLGAPWAVRLAAVAFAASAVAGLRLPRPAGDSHSSAEDHAGSTAAADGLCAVSIRVAAVAMGALRAVTGFLTFVVAFALRAASAPSWSFGLVLAASVVGALAGSAVAPRLRRSFAEERIIQGSLVLVSLVAAATVRLAGWPGAALLALAVGLAAAVAKLAFDSIVQRDAPDALRGRTFARFETHFQVAWVIGAGIPVLLPLSQADGTGLVALGAALTFFAYVGGMVSASSRENVDRG